MISLTNIVLATLYNWNTIDRYGVTLYSNVRILSLDHARSN